ncbi:MAG TPA: hypothetical protein PLP66_09845 [Phycisphaerae bacterium]|nr:hypothetical protein [Phycisphaerae bacterium]HQL55041.1 hypothetical protein [Phycisphaerae bacterium]
MKRLRTEAEALCRAVAPELAGRPLYVVLASDVYADPGNGDGPDGCTMRHLDLMLRPTLERLGRWSGRGPAMVLDPRSIARTAARRIRPARRRVFAPAALGVAIHELAHVLTAEPDEAEPTAEYVKAGRAMLTADADGTETPTNGPGAAVPWRGHEWAFIRAALHLTHRAAALGVDLTPRDVFDAEPHGLAPTGRYVAALGDEPDRLAGCDFATIARTPPPAAFAELWLADVRGWLERPDVRDEMVRMLARCAHRITIPQA